MSDDGDDSNRIDDDDCGRPARRLRSARCAARRPLPRSLCRLCWVADAASEGKAAACSLCVIGADADIVSRASDRADSSWATPGRPSRRPARCPTRRSPSCPSRRLSWPTYWAATSALVHASHPRGAGRRLPRFLLRAPTAAPAAPSRLLAARTGAPERLAFCSPLRPASARPLCLLAPARAAGALLLLLGSFVTIFKIRTLSGSTGRCSRGRAAGGEPPARYVTQPTPTTARARARAAARARVRRASAPLSRVVVRRLSNSLIALQEIFENPQ